MASDLDEAHLLSGCISGLKKEEKCLIQVDEGADYVKQEDHLPRKT